MMWKLAGRREGLPQLLYAILVVTARNTKRIGLSESRFIQTIE